MTASSIWPRVWLIGGPTASGKSGLALRIAEAEGAEVVNADSMQLYRDLAVLTARPSARDESRAPHHLYGVADAGEAWSVGRWLRAAREVLAAIAARRRPAVIVGGTGLYFHALTRGLADIPPVPEAVRTEVGERFDRFGEAAFREALAQRDPAAEARIAPGDRQRLVRAAAVAQATGRPLSAWQADASGDVLGAYRALVIDPPRETLYAACDARLTAMVEHGALDEVAALMARGLSPELPAMKALGVREFARYLSDDLSLEAALDLARQQTRQYAKRQTTWFRNQTPDWPRVLRPDDFAA